jgi:hypothetical protein
VHSWTPSTKLATSGFTTKIPENFAGIAILEGKTYCPCNPQVITYFGINLTSKKFQVGSTVNFEKRCKQHHNSDMNPEFNRALIKHPENFYWVVGEDDGLNTREEEQYYLDFYYGTVWCYNSNPNAEAPPSRKGKKWTEKSRQLLSQSNLDLIWVNDGEKAFRVPREQASCYNTGRGTTYNNGEKEIISLTPPGDGWNLGQLPEHKICPDNRKSFGVNNGKSLPILLKHPNSEEEIYYECISQACKENGLQKANLCSVLKGKRKHHKGFTARYA